MKLNTRILLLVAPVILLSAAVSGYTIYNGQRDALIKLEDSYLQLNMEKLAGHFRQSVSLLNSYSFTLTKSDIIRHYVANSDNPYRQFELIENLQDTIANLQASQQSFTGIAILDDKKRPQYYADNSNEPFAKLDPPILEYVEQTYDATSHTSHIGYTQNGQGDGVLVRYDALDKRTLSSPLSYNKNELFFVVVSVSLDAFNRLRNQIEFDNQSSIFFTPEPLAQAGTQTHTVKLLNDFYATLDPAHYLIRNKLNKVSQNLAIAFGLSSVTTVLLLLFLLYRHVIRPISTLERQLREVEGHKRKNIERLYSNDEIGRLSSRFYDMYQELDSTYQKTKVLAENDHLTQLANRHQFQAYAERALANQFQNRYVWVLYIDLDNFKYVNDKYGHQVGDSLLVSFAKHITALCEQFQSKYPVKCLASRLSGDEFAVFISTPRAHQVEHVAEEFAAQVIEPIASGKRSLLKNFPITASIGIATYPKDGKEVAKLLSNADTAMYQAKKAGKNQIAYYSEDLARAGQRRTQIERALRSGRFDDEFYLVYQPYFKHNGAQIAGVEALLRWESEQLGSIPPSEFIPIAEQIGLFGAIDRWVISAAFKDFHDLQAMFREAINLSINLSSAELDSLQLANFIHHEAQHYNVEPNLIDFEITETFAADSQSFPLLHELSLLGYKLAIDDFGSGYTSIKQLVQYPVQKIKLDRFFLETLLATNNKKVIKPLVELCQSQAMQVTAEGIETEEMRQWLSEYNCDYMQGFLFGEPMPLSQLRQWSEHNQGTSDVNQESHRSFA